VRLWYHLLTYCLKANLGKQSHDDVETRIIHHLNTYTSSTATKPIPDGKQAGRGERQV
jgi:hypothetical protein